MLTKSCQRRSSPPGFTLIELLVSSLLAAMLMLAIVGLMRTTNAQSKAARRALEANPATSILADQIRRDFVNARHIEVRPNRVRVSGYMAQDMRTGKPTFRPAEVIYAIVPNRQSTHLVRQETQSNQVVGNRSRMDVMWSGVASLKIFSSDDTDEEPEFAAPAPPGMISMPAHLTIALHTPDGEQVLNEEIFHHHAVQ